MPQENAPDTQKTSANTPNKAKQSNTSVPQAAPTTPSASTSSTKVTSGKGKRRRTQMGGTAVTGAKSLQPKPVPTSNSSNDQAESYNREMRRRMQHMGTGPYAQEEKLQSAQEKRQKQVERRKQKLEEQRAELRKTLPKGNVLLSRRNTYYLIGFVAAVAVIIALVIVLKVYHVF